VRRSFAIEIPQRQPTTCPRFQVLRTEADRTRASLSGLETNIGVLEAMLATIQAAVLKHVARAWAMV
tara:strand:- start:24 stop:224 length:201 start_codon:yes stop_codon:yes gene_type:complete